MLRLRWTVEPRFPGTKSVCVFFFGSVSAWREVEYVSRRVGWKWKHEGFLDLIWIYWNFFFNLEGGDQTLQWSFTRSEFGWNWDVFWFGVLPAKSTFWNGICQITFWKRIVWSLKASYISFESYFWGMYFLSFLPLIYQDLPFQEAANWFGGSQNALKLSKSRFHVSGSFETESYKTTNDWGWWPIWIYMI